MSRDAVCRDRHRRERVRQYSNGLDYIDTGEDRRTLTVQFFNPLPCEIRPEHLSIAGGSEHRGLQVEAVRRSAHPAADPDKAIDITLSAAADLAPYLLRIAGVSGIDPLYSTAAFTFADRCASRLDCSERPAEAAIGLVESRIDYLAKDYASFRQLMLDRLATTIPGWTERHVPDLGIAIVEVLAYVGDYLSYYQDAVATEAHLRTARRRISIRRHARLVDYSMHEGCNARAWLHLRAASEDRTLDLADTFFITTCRATAEEATSLLPAAALELVPASEYEVFEPVLDGDMPGAGRAGRVRFDVVAAHNEMQFYTWGSRTCWLRAGATAATLLDAWSEPPASNTGSAAASYRERKLRLQAGDIVVFEERRSPITGSAADADPGHRHAVRLTVVERLVDPLFDAPQGRPVVNLTWSDADALPFDLCLATPGPPPDCGALGPDPDRSDQTDMAVALGNIILVDHGRTVAEAEASWPEAIGPFQANPTLTVPTAAPVAACDEDGLPLAVPPAAARFDPRLARVNPTFVGPRPKRSAAAAAVLRQLPQEALADMTLYEERLGAGELRWSPRADLLDSDPLDPHFVVEIDDERVAHLRVGRTVNPGSRFRAQYRIGNGVAGNVGAGAIRHVVSRQGALSGLVVRNPLPAVGGVEPETAGDVKLRAPDAFRRTLERAVTADDYARIAERHPRVQRAAARLASGAARQAVVVAIDPVGGAHADRALLAEIKRMLFRYRRIGHDLDVVAASYAPLQLMLRICLKDGYLRGHVRRAVLDAFSNRRLAGGALGFFHPDRLTYGVSVYPSQIIATAQRVAGVDSVAIRVLRRAGDAAFPPVDDVAAELDSDTSAVLRGGELTIGPFEIARLDDDPNHPERGVLVLDLRGGR